MSKSGIRWMILHRDPQSKRLEAALDGYLRDVIARTERPASHARAARRASPTSDRNLAQVTTIPPNHTSRALSAALLSPQTPR
jgi:hypothetical protein